MVVLGKVTAVMRPASSRASRLQNLSNAPHAYHGRASRSGDEEIAFRFALCFIGSRIAGNILHEVAAALGAFALQHTYTSRGNITGFETDDATVAHLYVRAEPVGAEHPARSIERHRGGDGTFELFSGASQKALPNLLRPSHAAHQWIVQTAALERHGV